MRATLRDAIGQVRAHHVLLLILATAALHGAEGGDRLSDLHLLRGIGLPSLGDLEPIVWFGILDGVGLVLGIAALSYVRRRGHLEGHGLVAKLLALVDVLLIASAVGFAFVGFCGRRSCSGSSAVSGACEVRCSRHGSTRVSTPRPGPRSTRWEGRPTPSVRR
jgi:hypothetical protein